MCMPILVLTLALLLPVDAKISTHEYLMDKENNCNVIKECQLCDAIAYAEIPKCRITGRVTQWKCEGVEAAVVLFGRISKGVDGSQFIAGPGTIYVNRSCIRTKSENELLMVRLVTYMFEIRSKSSFSA